MADGRMIYPVGSGFPTTSLNDRGYHQAYDEFGLAFRNVSVNPILYGVNLNRENGTSSTSFVNSMICTEIRKSPYGGSISNDSSTMIGNRILPINTTLSSHSTNFMTTSSNKIKCFDGSTASETNRKFIYSTSNYPATGEVGLDIDNYDYFILLNPEIVTAGTDTIRPHFAKITRIIHFDEFGDGLEFSPSYPTAVPSGTNFEIFKGPLKTDTDIVAVSYGLRGDTATATDKYDVVNSVSLPTFYFYEDRLDIPNQLDYHEKYTLTSFRWWNYGQTIALATTVDGYAQFNRGTTSKYFTISDADYAKIEEGMSLFTSNNIHVGNVEKKYGSAGAYRIYLDFARVAISATTNSVTYKIGKTAQNVVFMTESKFNKTITNFGFEKLDAQLIDKYLEEDIVHSGYPSAYTDTGNQSTINPTRWQYIFPNAKRSTTDVKWNTSTSSSLVETTLDGGLSGSNKYITFEKSKYQNDKMSFIHEVILNKTHNQVSQLGRVKIVDSAGISHKTIKENKPLSFRNAIYNDSFFMKELNGNVSKTSSTLITFNNEIEEIDLKSFLGNKDIVEIDNYYYVINSINAKSNNTQSFSVLANKLKSANLWTVSSAIHEFDKAKIFITSITSDSYLNFNFVSDTQVHHLRNNLITLNEFSITKEKSRMHKTRLVSNLFPKTLNEIEFADKNNKYSKILDINRKFYQSTPISRLYYYNGAYSITEEIFNGNIEDITSQQEYGLMTYEVVGRDETSRVINDVTNLNLSTSTDIIYSSMPPKSTFNSISATSIAISGSTLTLNGVNQTTSGGHVPRKYWLYVDSNGQLIGEVSSASVSGTTNSTVTITLSHPALVSTASNVKYFRPLEDGNYISSLKTLSHNKLLTSSVSDSSSFIENGLSFENGFTYNYVATTDGANSNTGWKPIPTILFNSSNTGSLDSDGSLGYDINSPLRVNTEDSYFAFKLGNENGVTITENNIATTNSETFNIVDINTKSENNTIISIAPNFPMVLGRIENNTSDSRSNRSIYLINNNINTGGFLHRLPDTNTNLYVPKDTIRFWDIQRFKQGTITQTQDSIYNIGTTGQKLQGYGIAIGLRADGTLYDVAVSQTNSPINGSNTLDGWNYLSNFYGLSQDKLIKSYPYQIDSNWYEEDIDYNVFKQIDPRTVPLELFTTGDIYPNSKLRWNHISNSEHSEHTYLDYGLLLESKHKNSNTVTNHSNYTGSTQQSLITENEFESMSIKSASQTPNDMRRWGVIRLVETTFDWHFNPIEYDALTKNTKIPTVPYFDYVMMDKPALETASDDMALNNASSNVRLSSDDIGSGTLGGNVYYTTDFIGVNTSETLAIENAVRINGFLGVKQHGTWSSTSADQQWNGNSANNGGSTTIFNDVLTFQGYDDGSEVKYFGVQSWPLYSNKTTMIDKLVTPSVTSNYLRTVRTTNTHDIRFTDVFIPSPITALTNFRYGGKLRSGGSSSDDEFDGHNIILPIIPKAETGAANNNRGRTFSPFHHPDAWFGQNTNFLHTSRVIAALVDRQFNEGSDVTIADKYGLGITSDGASQGIAHLYDNCIGVFKDVKLAVTGNKGRKPNIEDNAIMASALSLDTSARYNAYESDVNSTSETQHTRNLMIDEKDVDKAMIGTKTSSYFLEGNFSDLVGQFNKTNSQDDTGATHNTNLGTVASAQFIVKPMFDLTAASSTLVFSNNNKTVTFTHSAASKHIWLSFVPNLTGQYIVSEKLNGGNTLSNQFVDGSPLFIAKILSHTVSVAPSTSAIETHVLTFDTAIDVSNNGTKYRLMKISETTFKEVKDKITFNVMNNRLENFVDFKTGQGISNDTDYSRVETVYDMYLLLDIDNINTYVERRTIATVNDNFTDGEVLDTFVTDGTTSSRQNISVSTSRTTLGADTETGLTFTFGGELNGNGVVSFSQVIDLTLEGRPKLKELDRCHIGSTFNVGTDVDTAIQKLILESGLDLDRTSSFITETGSIFEVQGSNGTLGVHTTKLNCYDKVTNIIVGDVLYTNTGYLVGQVTAISDGNNSANQTVTGNRITVDKLYYVPIQGNEFVKVNQKTFISTLNFSNIDTLSALNILSNNKDLEYTIADKKISLSNIGDTRKLRKFSINYRESERLISVENNVSLFDKANEVIVIGDKVTYTAKIETDAPKKVIRHIDPNIKTKSEAQQKANNILSVYHNDSRKIKLKLQKKGLELLTAGDIVNLNFPEHNIPNDDYRVFEIENVLSGVLVITVGTFNKTIAERLSEITLTQQAEASTTFSKDAVNTSTGRYIFDGININQLSFGYTISTPFGDGSNFGVSNIVGVSEDLGITHETKIIKRYNEEYYEQ